MSTILYKAGVDVQNQVRRISIQMPLDIAGHTVQGRQCQEGNAMREKERRKRALPETGAPIDPTIARSSTATIQDGGTSSASGGGCTKSTRTQKDSSNATKRRKRFVL